MKSILRTLALLLIATVSLSSCISVQEYQKAYLNDEDMILAHRRVEWLELSSQSYREGALGATGGKVGGGCGCN
jgi:uncharacterized protein DUF4266